MRISKTKPTSGRAANQKRAFRPAVDALETRLTLSASPSLQATAHAAETIRASRVAQGTVLGTISGQVINDTTGNGMRGVGIQLLDANGRLVQRTVTDASGQYQFGVTKDQPYVVRELAPRRFAQVSPTFATQAPTGSFVKGAGNNSWYYGGNTDPSNGPVGPFGWDTIAPAGDLPFESPINMRGPTVDLRSVLTVDYAPAVPKQIINNSHQIQVQFASSPGDSVTVAGQAFRLAQFHYHAPAESTVNGRASVAEEHFVNVSASGAETVVAVFLKLGAHNNALDPILAAADAHLTAPNSTTTADQTAVDFSQLLPSNTRGWFYQGSLTTPPLSQPVNWFVYRQPITLDRQQIMEYAQVAGASGFLPNARPVQPADGRRLNEIDNYVNFQGQSISGQDFALAPRFAR